MLIENLRRYSVGELVTALSDYREVVVSRVDDDTYNVKVKTNCLARVVNIVEMVKYSYNLTMFMNYSHFSEFYNIDIHLDVEEPF